MTAVNNPSPPPPVRGCRGKGARPHLVNHARSMRREPTPPERALWRALRAKAIAGLKFRRQNIIGRYIVDLYCEVDGATHADSTTDPVRDAWRATQGIKVIRFSNNEVLGNLAGVLQIIAQTAVARTPLPTSSHNESGLCTDQSREDRAARQSER